MNVTTDPLAPSSAPRVRAALYACARQAPTSVTTDRQLDECRALVAEKDWEVVGEYVDIGRKSDERVGYHAMLIGIHTGTIDVVVVSEPDRLDTDLAAAEHYLAVCGEAGVSTWFVNGGLPWEPDSEAARRSIVEAITGRSGIPRSAITRIRHGQRMGSIGELVRRGGSKAILDALNSADSGPPPTLTSQPVRPTEPASDEAAWFDVDDTGRCPLARACASCHEPADTLEIATVVTDVGVLCLTICRACVEANSLPTFDPVTAVELVCEHCEHLGCDVEAMAAALKARTR